jgi:osmotically-inducible protein OsmY
MAMAQSLLERVRVEYDDEDLRFRVFNFLHSRHFPKLRVLQVKAQNGVVTLSGKVTSYYEKQVALNSCRRVAGVLSLVDCVDVLEEENDLPNRDEWGSYPLFEEQFRS